jgi:catechol 2,3-dioxygenase-like lactoylglutathione lyase family enzyme
VLAHECSDLYYAAGELPAVRTAGAAKPTVVGVAETALYVSDLAHSEQFYRRLFGFEPIYSEGDRMRALAVPNQQVLLLFRRGGSTAGIEGSGGWIPGHDGSGNLHLAFSVPRDQAEVWERRLEELGTPVESRVECAGGGVSLYFRDPDHHLIELITPGCWKWPAASSAQFGVK